MKMLFAAASLALLPASALFAQNLTGDWQGTLQLPNRELRIVFKISTTDKDSLKGMMYSIDQPGPGVPASTVTWQSPAVKILFPGINGTFEGKMSQDGNSIAGNWSQGPTPLPLNMTRATKETAWAIPEPPPIPKKMRADADPVFEVATIKPTKPGTQGKGFRVNGRHFSTINTSLSDLMTFAYGLHPRQIAGGPDWLELEKYDIDAQPDGEGQPNDKQWKTMVQKLLADRFRLAFHRDKKELSAYVLVALKTGPKLTKSEGDPNGLPGLGFGKLGSLNARNATMGDFTGLLQGAVLDRPVVDQTGITGRYDFSLNWTPDETQFTSFGVKIPPPPDDPAAPPDLFTAIQKQLGLKLDSARTAVEVLVIDKVEKPGEN